MHLNPELWRFQLFETEAMLLFWTGAVFLLSGSMESWTCVLLLLLHVATGHNTPTRSRQLQISKKLRKNTLFEFWEGWHVRIWSDENLRCFNDICYVHKDINDAQHQWLYLNHLFMDQSHIHFYDVERCCRTTSQCQKWLWRWVPYGHTVLLLVCSAR